MVEGRQASGDTFGKVSRLDHIFFFLSKNNFICNYNFKKKVILFG